MLFQTPAYVAFLLIVLALFYSLPLRAGRVVLLIASYGFYMSWNKTLVLLLFALTVVDFTVAQLLTRQSGKRRLGILWVGVGANLAFLGFFKYYNFFAASLATLLGFPSDHFFLSIILPVGISFHTFQSIAYLVDVHREEQPPIRNFIDYALFIAFFPQLVAGPIVRPERFFTELYDWKRPTLEQVERGVFLIGLGLTKKLVAADHFAVLSDRYFGSIGAHPGWISACSGAFAFAMQIYFDFGGYTDIAVGTAALFGFAFPPNFAQPYFATSISEFWRRWHMSLSTWLRDYLYISLGGNRRGKVRTYVNLFLTMLLGGLWHGASWHFMIWGGYHGVWLAIERAFRRTGTSQLAGLRQRALRDVPAIAVTFIIVCAGWVLFRAPSLGAAWEVFRNMAVPGGTPMLDWLSVGIVLVAMAIGLWDGRRPILDRLALAPLWAQSATAACLLFALEVLSYTQQAIPFIYFQF